MPGSYQSYLHPPYPGVPFDIIIIDGYASPPFRPLRLTSVYISFLIVFLVSYLAAKGPHRETYMQRIKIKS